MNDHNSMSKVNKKGDKGSTLITVIVAIAFVTILTSIILGTTVVNVRMKGIDKRERDEFYLAEKSLNDIYTGLGQQLANIAGNKYDEIFKKVGNTDDSTKDFNMAETAEKEFHQEFIKAAFIFANSKKDDLGDYILATSKGSVDKVTGVECQKKDGVTCLYTSPDANRVVIKGVQVSAEDTTTGIHSVISTDIVIIPPVVDFLGTNVDVSDYGLIANKGLYINGKAKINGNVYAGLYQVTDSEDPENKYPQTSDLDYDFYETSDKSLKEKIFGGINIKNGKVEFNSNYIISKGDINLAGANPAIRVNSGANLSNLWFTSLRTISNTTLDPNNSPKIDINANVFALNDLVLNADCSDVTIKGNYYGYNDKATLPAALQIIGVKTNRDDGASSAIIINGRKASLNMEKIKNFVLMGKAYIDFTSVSYTKSDAITEQIVPTAEGVALKTNQQLYLVPPDFLDGPNPALDKDDVKISVSKDDIKKWFGLKYLDYGTDINDPDLSKIHTKYKVTLSDGHILYYDYLNFDEKKTWKKEGTIYKRDLISGDPDDPDDFDDPSNYNPIGTGGSVSSKAAFFFEVMNAKTYNESVESTEFQPSAYRLNERVGLSLSNPDYFDLQQCVVGNSAGDAHYYAKNAIVNYKRIKDPYDASKEIIQSDVFDNTSGMGRYAGYPQYLFHRYVFLCTDLDGKEDILLSADPDYPNGLSEPMPPDMTEWGNIASTRPFSRFVVSGNIPKPSNTEAENAYLSGVQTKAEAAGIKPTAFGVCIVEKPVSGTLNLSNSNIVKLSGSTFKGVAIIDGDIVVPENYKVDGLLMATGRIILEGNNEISYNKGLVQSRIEKEMNLVKNWEKTDEDTTPYKDYYLINYLSKKDGTTKLYDVTPGSKIKRDRIEADYNDFMHYESWQKGEQ